MKPSTFDNVFPLKEDCVLFDEVNSLDELETHILTRQLNLLNYIFAAEELDINDFPDFIPRTIARIEWVRGHRWSK